MKIFYSWTVSRIVAKQVRREIFHLRITRTVLVRREMFHLRITKTVFRFCALLAKRNNSYLVSLDFDPPPIGTSILSETS
jgi:hypothetical protein